MQRSFAALSGSFTEKKCDKSFSLFRFGSISSSQVRMALILVVAICTKVIYCGRERIFVFRLQSSFCVSLFRFDFFFLSAAFSVNKKLTRNKKKKKKKRILFRHFVMFPFSLFAITFDMISFVFISFSFIIFILFSCLFWSYLTN